MCVGDGACGPGAHRRAQGPRTARPQACPSAWGRQAPWAASRQGCTVTVCGLREVRRDARRTPRARQAQGPEQARALPTPPPPSSRSGEEAAAAPRGWCPRPPALSGAREGLWHCWETPSPGRGWRPEGPPPQGPLTPLPITSQVSQTYAKPLTGSPGVGENPPHAGGGPGCDPSGRASRVYSPFQAEHRRAPSPPTAGAVVTVLSPCLGPTQRGDRCQKKGGREDRSGGGRFMA